MCWQKRRRTSKNKMTLPFNRCSACFVGVACFCVSAPFHLFLKGATIIGTWLSVCLDGFNTFSTHIWFLYWQSLTRIAVDGSEFIEFNQSAAWTDSKSSVG